ncbi:MAG: hypothetical protein ABI977_31855 [Acidobacteriota bacterium]
MTERQVFHQWVRATWAGWVLGVPFVIALALIGEAVGIGGVQVLVGVGMGAGIGLMQGRASRSVLHMVAPWFWSCVVGLGLPFLTWDIAKAAGWDFPYSLYVSVALGGLIVGIWQAFLLRPHIHKIGWWVAASMVGWNLAAGTAAIADSLFRSRSLRGIWGALASLGIIAAGGLILGLVTGGSLVWLLRQKPAG